MNIFSPPNDALCNDREKFQILLCPLKLLNQKKERNKERDLNKKNGIGKYYYHI